MEQEGLAETRPRCLRRTEKNESKHVSASATTVARRAESDRIRGSKMETKDFALMKRSDIAAVWCSSRAIKHSGCDLSASAVTGPKEN